MPDRSSENDSSLGMGIFKGLQTCSGFPGGSDRKASAYNVGDPGSIPGLGRSSGEGNGNPLLPGKSHGRRSLVGYSLWGCKESDMTERLHSLNKVLRIIL